MHQSYSVNHKLWNSCTDIFSTGAHLLCTKFTFTEAQGLPKANSFACQVGKLCWQAVYVLRLVLTVHGFSIELANRLNEWILGMPRAFQPSWSIQLKASMGLHWRQYELCFVIRLVVSTHNLSSELTKRPANEWALGLPWAFQHSWSRMLHGAARPRGPRLVNYPVNGSNPIR